MRILWFTNCLLPKAYELFGLRQSYQGGGWMESQLNALREYYPKVKICIATANFVPHTVKRFDDGVQYICFPYCRRLRQEWIEPMLDEAAAVVRDYCPDLVHVHGSELFYGLIAEHPTVSCPVAVSLQGLIGPYSAWPAFFGNHTPLEVLRLQRGLELLKGHGLIPEYLRFQHDAQREHRILAAIRHVMGRTQWDCDYAMAVNPALNYYHVGELLRRPFWGASWSLHNCFRNTIIFTNAGHPRKGADVLLKAFRIVLKRFPNARLLIAGSIGPADAYGSHIYRQLEEFDERVSLLGTLTPQEMVAALLGSHVFVSPSFIDNSPNALCEAQLLGMPVISTYVGGVPSLIKDRQTGVFAVAGDPSSIAGRIMEIFEGDDFATFLGTNGRKFAMQRHDPYTVVNQLIQAYEAVLGKK